MLSGAGWMFLAWVVGGIVYLMLNFAAKGEKYDTITSFLFGVVITLMVMMMIFSGGY